MKYDLSKQWEKEWPLDRSLEYLRHLDQFKAFMNSIYYKREACIKDLAGAEDGRVRELSGMIQAFDEILGEGQG